MLLPCPGPKVFIRATKDKGIRLIAAASIGTKFLDNTLSSHHLASFKRSHTLVAEAPTGLQIGFMSIAPGIHLSFQILVEDPSPMGQINPLSNTVLPAKMPHKVCDEY
jgi:hypothetical protein